MGAKGVQPNAIGSTSALFRRSAGKLGADARDWLAGGFGRNAAPGATSAGRDMAKVGRAEWSVAD